MIVLNGQRISDHRAQKGQSMVEMAILLPIIIMLVLALVEVGIVFANYIALVNAAHEGAAFASMYPELGDRTCGSLGNPSTNLNGVGCIGAFDSEIYGGGSNNITIWNEYYDRVQSDVHTVVGEQLRAGGLLNQDILAVDRPVQDPATKSGCSLGTEQLCTITVTVHYRLHTFTSEVSMPGVGRFGLPNYYQLNYTFSMAIR